MKEKFILDKLSNMTLSEKIGQMIMIDYRDTLEMNVELEEVLNKYSPGGFILFKSNIGSDENKTSLENYKQVRKLLTDIKSSSEIPVMVSTDQEGGRVQRLGERVGFDTIPPMGEVAKTMNKDEIFNLGKKVGSELKGIGVDMDMAPVLDVFSNPKNTAIGDRAFGTDPDTVKELSMAFANGLQEEKIVPVGKHFPGHGGTLKDSHVDLPFIPKELDEMKKLELIPFIEAIHNNIPGLMVGHLAVPKLTGDNNPASLSGVMINDLLRKDLGYKGLVMPDSLKMKALSNYFSEEDIYLRCVNAGNDLMLMPQNINVAFDTIKNAVDYGKISEEQIDNSVLRILSIKFDLGFFDKEYSEYSKKQKRL